MPTKKKKRQTSAKPEPAGALPTRQVRSRDTKEAILQAATSIIREQGAPELSIERVATLAGCSVGTIYRRFRDKDSLLIEVMDQWAQGYADFAKQILHPGNWVGRRISEILAAYLDIAANNTRTSGGLSRALLLLALRDERFEQRANHLQATIDQGLRRLLLARRAEIRHPRPTTAITVVLELVRASLMARRFGPPMHQPTRLSDAKFAAELLLICHRHLELPG